MNLLLATQNKGKIIEIQECLSSLPINIKLPSDFGITESPHEHGTTFRDNAIIKATYYHELSGIPTLADDSGIVVEALREELGVQTRRFGAGAEASDQEWIDFFLKRMEKEENKKAQFICCLALIDVEGILHTFDGICDGMISETLEAGYLPGLPISACFKPSGYGAVYSAMSIDQKNSTSHRGKALASLRKYLQETLT